MDTTKDEKAEKKKFHVDMGLIPAAQLTDETCDLKELHIGVFNQDDFEKGVMQQVDDAISKENNKKKKEALKKDLKNINDEIRSVKHDLASLATQLAQLGKGVSSGGANRRLITAQKQKEAKMNSLKELEEKKKTVQAKLDGKIPLFDQNELGLSSAIGLSENTGIDKLIRLGEMTPFGTVAELSEMNVEAMDSVAMKENLANKDRTQTKNLMDRAPGFTGVTHSADSKMEYKLSEESELSDLDNHSDGEEWLPSDNHQLQESDVDTCPDEVKHHGVKHEKPGKHRRKKKGWSKTYNRPIYHSTSEVSDSDSENMPRAKAIRRYRDDGHEEYFLQRIEKFNESELAKQRLREAGSLEDSDDDEEFDGGLKVPGRIWSKLFKYQKTCVKWLWELHCQQAGGIVGDEMGLGKTIEAIAFLAALKYSKTRNRNFSFLGLGPTLIVCPATVMHQWVKEFHTWWPLFRVAILHSSGTHMGNEKDLIRQIVKNNGILVTSYSTLVVQKESILLYDWHYVVLDEGHKIRNPDVQATLVCKQFRTPHRIILSGSPIQNNLKELWSLMDFVFPGKLGTLPDFMQHFAVPIVQGGYSNATDIQVQTAYKCACVLRDTINPYLLRRMKADVKMNVNLPGKTEQVLFCRLTKEQREVYEEYLASRECQEILRGRLMVFAGLIQLRKICNHPDLSTGGPRVFKSDLATDNDPSLDYGYWKRAGKMIVVDALLKLWKKQGHKALFFTQSKQMLDIMEKYVTEKGYSYVRMDGGTGISSRQPLVQRFNTDDSIYLFLLTTRVGGLGVNLIGANRIIIYDPDWNPSTDMQAKERAWRIGQKRQVTIYRLLTTGTIEEKIYHRQIFKQFLTNRVLKDPKQRRLFKTNDLFELFSLGLSDDKGETETAAIFSGTGSEVTVTTPKKKNRFDKLKENIKKDEAEEENSDDVEKETNAAMNFDADEIIRMRELARKLSQNMEKNKCEKSVSKLDEKTCGSNSISNVKTLENLTHTDGDLCIQTKHAQLQYSKNTSIADPRSYKISSLSRIKVMDGEKLKQFKIRKRPSVEELALPSFILQDNSDKISSQESARRKGTTSEKALSRTDITTFTKKEKHRDKCKHKKHKAKDAKYEGKRIPHLDKLRKYKPPIDLETLPNNDDKDSEEMNNYVLHKLFKKTGIQGALRHDKIMEPGKPDYVIVEAEATKVAREASQALKRSRSHCLPATAGVPTWTGQHGGAVKRPRFGQKKSTVLSSAVAETSFTSQEKDEKPTKSGECHFDGSLAGSVQTNIGTGATLPGAVSSTDLLNKMRIRNDVFSSAEAANDDNANNDDDDTTFVSDPASFELIKRMREFIMFECQKFGQASTKELLDEFRSKLPPENSAKFRALLHSICEFEKKDGSGVWKLRQDFR